jgi:hypothetical protein
VVWVVGVVGARVGMGLVLAGRMEEVEVDVGDVVGIGGAQADDAGGVTRAHFQHVPGETVEV